MIRRRHQAFQRAHDLLVTLQKAKPALLGSEPIRPHQLEPLLLLQALLIKEITRTERKIRRSKSFLKQVESEAEGEAVNLIEERIEQYRHLAYSWRCFGDAIAFLFLEKFSLKQTYFNTTNSNVKQGAGFIGDKTGFVGEWSALNVLLKNGIPALLTDLTNTIRHGDICTLFGPDPNLIEIKLGKIDSRGRRQKKSIEELAKFFETDSADKLRGFDNLRRVEHLTEEVVYADVMNDCIAAAEKSGTAQRSPETGLHYMAFKENSDVENAFDGLRLIEPIVFQLNEAKANRSWSPYYPFTLSITHGDTLYDFIWDSIYLVVIYDRSSLRELSKLEGYDITFEDPDSDLAFSITRLADGATVGVGRHMFHRIAFDFSSPAWLFRTAVEKMDYIDTNGAAGAAIAETDL